MNESLNDKIIYAKTKDVYDCDLLPDNYFADEYPKWKEYNYPIIHIIHNLARKDRFKILQKEIATQSLCVRFWPAIMDKIIPFRGVARAHKQIVRWAKEQGLQEVLIAEDDIKFFKPYAFLQFIQNKPNEYDLYLGNIFGGNIAEDNTVTDFAGLTMYYISERFYDTFLAANEMNNFDRSLAGLGKYVVCNPMVCSQYGGYSDNKKEYVADYDHHLKQYKTL